MFGNIINNAHLIELLKEGQISIDPFSTRNLKTIHYPLTPYTVLSAEGRGSDGEFRTKVQHQFQTDDDYYEFEPNEYFIIEIEEYISVAPGIVGHFVAPSNLIHQGFGLTAGRIEAPFGGVETGRLKVRFGLKNLLKSKKNALMKKDLIAYVYFVDLRGLNSLRVEETDRDRRLFDAWKRRKLRAEDDGAFPHSDEQD
jgi:deoxycytidine triphosphate deaminase